MRRFFSRPAVIAFCILLFLLFVVRPRAGRLRGRVSQSIAQAVGRRVEISSLHLRFLPRPGFTLDDLVVRDDSTFGSEPVLRAADVTAWLRVGALLHGRIEISSLSLSNASVNLSRGDQGRWNIEDLIERTSHTAMAPTGNGRQSGGPSFPYIEATHTRINFKEGAEKTHLALTNAEFSLWQESRDTWGVRLKAAPIRTDANLTDTGVISINGQWGRATNVHETPIVLSFEWKQAQIGQLSKLIYGTEKQWRGAVVLSGTAVGTPEKLKVTAAGSLEDFRRRDVLGPGTLRLSSRCEAELNLPGREMAELECAAPSGAGMVEVKGGASGPTSDHFPFSKYDLWLIADKAPAQGVLSLLQQTNAAFSGDLSATGELSGSVEISKAGDGQPQGWKGGGSFRQLQISSGDSGNDIILGTVPFSVTGETKDKHAPPRLIAGVYKKGKATDSELDKQPQVIIGPVNLAVGRPGVLRAQAVLRRDGYEAQVKGDTGIKRLLQLAQMLRIPSPAVSADGGSTVDLMIAGGWSGTPMVTGSAQLRSVRVEARGLNAPVEVVTASVAISKDAAHVTNLSTTAAGATLHGWLQIQRPCASASNCEFEFSLRAPELSAAALNSLLNPAVGRSWYRIISLTTRQPPFLLQARGSGKIAIDRLTLGKTDCSRFSADLKLDAGEITLANIQGEVLGGRASGRWKADFTKKPPQYSGDGTLGGGALAQVAELMHDGWIEGTGNVQYEFTSKGWAISDLVDSADLKAAFTVNDGAFPHVVLGSSHSGPLRGAEFSGNLRLQDGKFSFEDAKLESATGVYKVSGTALLKGNLDLKLSDETSAAYNLSGTLAKTRVTPIPIAQAELKP
ncbi:MAG: hypothetical protein DMG93_03550 [Acidobacteria bacterium]|nr:MAG: hypothetical protein DMG93_03550 [Acidobacteriota bacterium]